MTRPVPAIVEAFVDLKIIEREVQRRNVALQDAERTSTETGRRHEISVEAENRARVELGRELIRAKAACVHGEWLPFLERAGVETTKAWRCMELAGYVKEQSKFCTPDSVQNLKTPTLREAGIDKRPRKSAQSEQIPPATDWVDEVNRRKTAADLRTVESSLVAMMANALGTIARQWPGDVTRLAAELRLFADKLERRAKDQG